MKRVLFTALGLAPAMTGGGLVPGDPGGPVLTTPGTATWTTETTDSGIRAIYSITDDTILDWGQLDVPFGDELVFDFVGGSAGNSIANMLGGGTIHTIDGSVFSNGNVGFFSPGSDLVVNGSVTAASVTMATLGVDAADFIDGGGFVMNGGGLSFLSVAGEITATNGDVVLAGGFVDLDASSQVTASQAVRIGAADQVAVAADGSKRLQTGSGLGFVLNLGEANAATIEIAATNAVSNGGRIQAADGIGQIFLEVGPGGQITNEGSGLLVGNTSPVGAFVDGGSTFDPDEGDAAVGLNPSALKIPALRRPDGTRINRERVVRNDAPMAASADAGRDRNRTPVAVAGKARGSLMKRASFFGMRGGMSANQKKSR